MILNVAGECCVYGAMHFAHSVKKMNSNIVFVCCFFFRGDKRWRYTNTRHRHYTLKAAVSDYPLTHTYTLTLVLVFIGRFVRSFRSFISFRVGSSSYTTAISTGRIEVKPTPTTQHQFTILRCMINTFFRVSFFECLKIFDFSFIRLRTIFGFVDSI